VTVIGAGQGADPATDTILDGGGTRRVLDILSGTVALHWLRVRNGNGGTSLVSGGIQQDGGSLTLHDCTVTANRGRTGGGIRQDSGALAMTRCTVSDNAAKTPGGGAPAIHGGGLNISGSAILTDCQITGNTATDGPGGGIYFSGISGALTLAGTTRIAGNRARSGGGIHSNAPTNSITIGEECRITGNTASDGFGGGIRRDSTGTVILLGPDPSPIVTSNCHENCVGDVPKCAPGGTCPA
jgi:hypothetical protein